MKPWLAASRSFCLVAFLRPAWGLVASLRPARGLVASLLIFAAIVSPHALLTAAEPVDSLTLWYDGPARHWVEALPVGNGRLGAMTYGGTTSDTLQLNEDTFWAGSPYNNINPLAKSHLAEIREALEQGQWDKAQYLAMHNITADKSKTGHGMRYESLGNLVFTFPDSHAAAAGYRRQLSLNEAVAATSYTVDGVRYRREVFASYADSVIVVRLSASRPGSLSFSLRFASPEKNIDATSRLNIDKKTGSALMTVTSKAREAAMEHVPNRLVAKTLVKAVPKGGTMSIGDGALQVSDADEVLLFIAARTNFVRYDNIRGNAERRALRDLEGLRTDFDLLKMRHLRPYRAQFDRVKLSLGHNPVQEAKPTDVRLREFSSFYSDEGLPLGNGGGDPGLVALYFQYGRYLLMSSSQPGTQPANLQGIWNPDQGAYPAWDSKYTTNINVEMNYWPAEVTNLSECHQPFLQLVEDVSRTGRRSAREMYGARGWTLHHNTDLWRSTGAVDYSPCSVWPSCNAWFCSHLMEHYLFTGDRDFLARAYPIMKEASQFYQDFLIRDKKTGYLVASPSNSPENNPGFREYSYQDSVFNKKMNASVFQGVAMDNEMIYDLLKNTAEAARILGLDAAFADTLDALKSQLPPMMAGRYGQLQEWLDDWDAEYTGHRHVSHLWGAFPGRQMSLYRHPEVAAAVKKTLIGRGDASRGWSMGWKVCLWARLMEGNHAFLLIRNQLKLKDSNATIRDPDGGTYANGFDAHPPFQIDGNFGCAAGIAEMLVQSHDGCVDLLPALPEALPSGYVSGLRTRGGFEIVSMTWEKGALRSVSLRSDLGGTLRLRSQVALRRDGQLLPAADASTPCDNPLLQPYDILTPVVRDSARLLPVLPRQARVYDIPTRAGEVVTLDGVTTLSVAGRYLLENGRPFFWMGNTTWLIQSLDSIECETYCTRLEEEGYNVIQIQVLNGISPDFRTHDWAHLDQIVRIAARHHIYCALVPIWGGLVKRGQLTVDDAREYGRMLARRYGNQWNIVWMVGGDVPGSVKPEIWTALGETLRADDGLHLITYHPRGRTLSATWWNDAPWLDFHSFQSGHRRYGQTLNGKVSDGEFLTPEQYEDNWHYVSKSRAMNAKPVVDAEPSYEHIPQGLHDPKEPLWEAPDIRRFAWLSVLSGAMGHTYGHNAQMSMYDPTRSSGDGPYGCRQSWQSSLGDDGFLDMRWLKRLFESLVTIDNLASLRPDQSLITEPGDHHAYIPVLRAADFVVAYDYTSRPFTLDLAALGLRKGATLSAAWYSPSTGEYTPIPDVQPQKTEFRPLQPEADGNDCVLVIKTL